MDLLIEGLLFLLLIGVVLLRYVVLPARELRAMTRRIAAGDYRPFILKKIPGFLGGTAADLRLITETLSRQQAMLAEDEFSIATILGRMTEGVVIIGSDLRIRMVNEAAMAMFNLRGGVVGFLLQEVFLSHELRELALQASGTGELQRGELSVTIPGRTEPCALIVTVAPLKSPEVKSPEGLLIVLHDITRLRELESVRREFVANVSHEFRTPLSIITGYLETLEDGEISKEMLRKSITVMRRHGDRLNHLIEDLLTISRMQEKEALIETHPRDLKPIMRGVMEQMERAIEERGAVVRLEIPSNLPRVEVDFYRIEQAFSNLLANALRHGRPEGGKIDITMAVQGEELKISFRDNGPGIPLKDQEHIFERFYRVGGDRARHTGGTGLGLSIVKHVVAAHRGYISLESKPGEGADFSVFLPVAGQNRDWKKLSSG